MQGGEYSHDLHHLSTPIHAPTPSFSLKSSKTQTPRLEEQQVFRDASTCPWLWAPGGHTAYQTRRPVSGDGRTQPSSGPRAVGAGGRDRNVADSRRQEGGQTAPARRPGLHQRPCPAPTPPAALGEPTHIPSPGAARLRLPPPSAPPPPPRLLSPLLPLVTQSPPRKANPLSSRIATSAASPAEVEAWPSVGVSGGCAPAPPRARPTAAKFKCAQDAAGLSPLAPQSDPGKQPALGAPDFKRAPPPRPEKPGCEGGASGPAAPSLPEGQPSPVFPAPGSRRGRRDPSPRRQRSL